MINPLAAISEIETYALFSNVIIRIKFFQNAMEIHTTRRTIFTTNGRPETKAHFYIIGGSKTPTPGKLSLDTSHQAIEIQVTEN